jgi:hypothetical protein
MVQGKKAQPLRAPLALPGIDLTEIIDAVADRLSVKLQGAAPIGGNKDEPLLLTIEQAARKLGRTVSATEHMIRSEKLKAVRIDSRVQIDYRDILALIDRSKTSEL